MNYKNFPNKRNEMIELLLGCSVEFFESVQPGTNPSTSKSPSNRYLDQKSKAAKRGIEWKFNFKEWWEVWEKSGKWQLRGRGAGYCMARVGDIGAYETGNVKIKTIGENFSESFIKHPQQLRNKKAIENGKIPKEFCKRGHKLSETRHISINGKMNCRECQKIRSNENYLRSKAKKEVYL